MDRFNDTATITFTHSSGAGVSTLLFRRIGEELMLSMVFLPKMGKAKVCEVWMSHDDMDKARLPNVDKGDPLDVDITRGLAEVVSKTFDAFMADHVLVKNPEMKSGSYKSEQWPELVNFGVAANRMFSLLRGKFPMPKANVPLPVLVIEDGKSLALTR